MRGQPTGGHLDLDALADVLAGERPDDPHLRTCAGCADRLAELAAAEVAVAASLATLPEPALPDGLSQRLTEALRAEQAGTRTVTPLPRRRPPRRAAPWLSRVAAGLLLVLAGGVGLGLLRGATSDGQDAASTAAGGGAGEADEQAAPSQPEAAGVLRAASGVDYADPSARAAVLPRLLDGTAPDAEVVPLPSLPPGSTFDVGTPTGPPTPAGTRSRDRTVGLARLRDPQLLAECLAALRAAGGPDAAPLALDEAAYTGAPALAVLQDDGDPRSLLLTVVGPGCSTPDPDTLQRVRVDRP